LVFKYPKYSLNSFFIWEFREYLKYLKSRDDELNPDDYLFKSQKMNKPYNRVSISRLFANIYKKFNIHGASHFCRHLFVSKLVNSGVNIFQFRHQFVRCCHLNSLCLIALRIKTIHRIVFIYAVQKLANHRNIGTTQRYFNYNSQMLSNAVESLKI
jgi:site-specific recombinase XerD